MIPSARVLLAIGTRPEVIKMAPIYYDLVKRGIKPVLLHTGQHNEMATALYQLFGIIPDYSLISRTPDMIKEQSHGKPVCELSTQSSNLLHTISTTMMEVNPDIVLVHGDTSSALMSALAAFYQKRPIAHIEAGLRSHNEYDPFPEEKNRVLIGQLARWHFAPTEGAKKNLLAQGISESTIHVVGNTVVDAAQLGVQKLNETLDNKDLSGNYHLIHMLAPQLDTRTLLMVTVHRRENHGRNIESIAKTVLHLLQENPHYLIVWPVHPNPKVKDAVHSFFGTIPEEVRSRLYLTEPLDYPVLLWVLQKAWLVLTDSGGIQEEAVALNTPILVLRETTERPEIIESGAGILVGTDSKAILQQVDLLNREKKRYQAMCNVQNPFGDGRTAYHIGNIIMKEKFSEKKYA